MKAKRPVIELPMTPMEWLLQAVTTIILLATIAVVAYYWNQLPGQITIHFNIFGKPDNQGTKDWLIYLCGLSILNFLLMTVISRFPHTYNYLRPVTEANAAHQYSLARKFMFVMNLEVTGIMFFAIWSCIQVSLGASSTLDMTSMVTLLVALLISSGIYTYRASRA